MLSKKRLDAVKVWEEIEEAAREQDHPRGQGHRGEQGRHRRQRQGRARVRSRFPVRPAPRCGSERDDRSDRLTCASPRSTVPAAAWSVPSAPCSMRPVRPRRLPIWESIEVGKHYTGTVKSMTSYGVFVDIGGVDGMVHISELSWSRIKTSRRGRLRGRHAGCVCHLLRPREAQDLPGRARIAA